MAEKKINGKAAASAVAAVTAAGVLVGGAFASPDELLEDGPGPLVQSLDADASPADDGGGSADEEGSETGEEKRSLRGGIRRMVRSAPTGVRALVFVPLWALGTVVTALVTALWSSVLSPVAAAVLGWLAIALLAVIIFTLAAKTVFPDLPLKKILNRHSLRTIVLLCLGFGMIDALLPVFWDSYETVSKLLKVFGSLIAAGVPLIFFISRRKRRMLAEVEGEPVELETPAQSPEECERAARKLVEDLADSVCPKLR
ncbi:MAG: hypothetical protein Q4E45_00705 [Eubacteriales bacterium]|nr:hypothetical protein [Eubacteriales bacterium]